VKEKDYIHI